LKKPPTKWNKIFASYTSDKELIARIYRELKKLNFPKINDPIKKSATELSRTFSKEEVQITKIHMKKCSPFLAIKEMQIKTMLQFHLTPVRIATIKNTTNSKCWRGCREKGTLIHCWWECKLVQPLRKTICGLLKKLKIDLPYYLAIPLLRINPKEYESGYHKGTCTPMFIAALFTIAKLWKKDAPLLMNELRKCDIYTQWNFTQPQRRMKLCHLQVNGWNIILSEVSQA
jgi:hypothetical protein